MESAPQPIYIDQELTTELLAAIDLVRETVPTAIDRQREVGVLAIRSSSHGKPWAFERVPGEKPPETQRVRIVTKHHDESGERRIIVVHQYIQPGTPKDEIDQRITIIDELGDVRQAETSMYSSDDGLAVFEEDYGKDSWITIMHCLNIHNDGTASGSVRRAAHGPVHSDVAGSIEADELEEFHSIVFGGGHNAHYGSHELTPYDASSLVGSLKDFIDYSSNHKT